MKQVFNPNQATHRYFIIERDLMVYVVANSIIEVSIESGMPVTKIEIKNGDKWEFGS